MFSVTQGIKDHKVQISMDGIILYEFTNATVELEDCLVLIKSGNETLVKLWSSQCCWYLAIETP